MTETQDDGVNTCAHCMRREYELGLQALEAKVNGYFALSTERFEAIKLRFSERDIRFNQQASDHQAVVAAALTSTQRQVEQLAATALELGSLAQKVTSLEGRREGGNQAVGWIVTLAGLVITAILGLTGLLISHILTTGSINMH